MAEKKGCGRPLLGALLLLGLIFWGISICVQQDSGPHPAEV
jgi:hypothetical protein